MVVVGGGSGGGVCDLGRGRRELTGARARVA